MKRHFLALVLVMTLSRIAAVPVDFQFSGQIVFSRDDAGWFSGAFPSNTTFTGRIHYDTSLASGDVSNPADSSYAQYQFHPNLADPPAMLVTDVNGHSFSSANQFFINTYDNYGLNPPLPGLTPFDEIYYATYSNFRFDNLALTSPHQFADFGIHFNSGILTSTSSDALPLAAPDLAAFGNSFIDIFLFGYGNNPPIVWYRGNITSITPVPEPAATALLLTGACLWFCHRRQGRP